MEGLQNSIVHEAVEQIPKMRGPGRPSPSPEDAVRNAVRLIIETTAEDDDWVTVGYGKDAAMYDQYGQEPGESRPDWWDDFPPIEGTRFRVFYEDDDGTAPPEIVQEAMLVIGATPAGIYTDDDKDSYDHRGRVTAHYLLPDGAPIHHAVKQRR